MKINHKVIKKFKPYEDRFDNFVKEYGDKSFTPAQFMGLKRITQSDKIWVAVRLLSDENRRLAIADIAESVIHLYESKYPNDDRPRKAIDAARSGDLKLTAAYAAYAASASASAYAYAAASAAYAASASASAYAYAAASASASAYTYAAASASAYTYAAAAASAASASYAASASASAYAYAAHASAAYAASAAQNKQEQEHLNRKILLKYLNK